MAFNIFFLKIVLLFIGLIPIKSLIGTTNVSLQRSFSIVDTMTKPLKVGDRLPDIVFNKGINFPKTYKTTTDLRGKFVLLDFWSTGCSSCIEAFPKMERLQKMFADKLQIILVNPWEDENRIADRMDKMRLAENEKRPLLPSIQGDKTWKYMFPATTIPHHVWIDPNGEVIAITGGYNANEYNISKLLRGEKIDMILKPMIDSFDSQSFSSRAKEIVPTRQSSFFDFYESGGIYGSIAKNIIDSLNGTVRNTYINVDPMLPFKDLYLMIFPNDRALTRDRIVFELKDSTIFQVPKQDWKYDEWIRRTRFCYEAIFPVEKGKDIYPIMFQELNDNLSRKLGIHFSIEDRLKRCYILVRSSQKLFLKTDGRSSGIIHPNGDDSLYQYANISFRDVVKMLQANFSNLPIGQTLIDEVAYKDNVDISFFKIRNLQDIPALKQSLSKYGLDILEEDRVVKVLVVKET